MLLIYYAGRISDSKYKHFLNGHDAFSFPIHGIFKSKSFCFPDRRKGMKHGVALNSYIQHKLSSANTFNYIFGVSRLRYPSTIFSFEFHR